MRLDPEHLVDGVAGGVGVAQGAAGIREAEPGLHVRLACGERALECRARGAPVAALQSHDAAVGDRVGVGGGHGGGVARVVRGHDASSGILYDVWLLTARQAREARRRRSAVRFAATEEEDTCIRLLANGSPNGARRSPSAHAGLMVSATAVPADSAADAGLQRVKSRYVKEVQVRPGALAGFRQAMVEPTKIDVTPAQVRSSDAFSTTRAAPESEVASQLEGAGRAVRRSVAEALKAKGFTIVDQPGPGVLRASPRIVDMHFNYAGGVRYGATKSYTREAGDAELMLELTDSVNNTVLARSTDKRVANQTPNRAARADTGSEQFWFDTLFQRWAHQTVDAMVGAGRRAS